MTSSNPETRARVLAGGLDLLSEVGLSGVTLGVLADQVGLSKSGLFAHFRSKEQVQIALLEHSAALANAHVLQPAMRVPAGMPRLKAVVHAWFGWSARAGLRGGCPVAAALFELDDVESVVRDKVVELEQRWRGVLRELVQGALDRAQLRRSVDVEQFVWELCGIYLSHHASQRFLRDSRADARARTAFATLVRGARGTSDSSSNAQRRAPSSANATKPRR